MTSERLVCGVSEKAGGRKTTTSENNEKKKKRKRVNCQQIGQENVTLSPGACTVSYLLPRTSSSERKIARPTAKWQCPSTSSPCNPFSAPKVAPLTRAAWAIHHSRCTHALTKSLVRSKRTEKNRSETQSKRGRAKSNGTTKR